MIKKKKSITLIITLIAIGIISIVAFSSAVFLGQRILEAHTRLDMVRAILTSQAGLHYVGYRYRVDGLPAYGTIAIAANQSFTTTGAEGGAADYLIVHTPQGSPRYLSFRVPIQNINSVNSITISSVSLSWSPNQNQIVTRVYCGGTRVYRWQWWGGGDPLYSGDLIDIDDYSLSPGQTVDFSARFFWAIQNTEYLTLTFNMSDGSSKSVTWYRVPTAENQNAVLFLSKSTGKVTIGNTLYRTVQADIDISNPDTTYISVAREIDEDVSP